LSAFFFGFFCQPLSPVPQRLAKKEKKYFCVFCGANYIGCFKDAAPEKTVPKTVRFFMGFLLEKLLGLMCGIPVIFCSAQGNKKHDREFAFAVFGTVFSPYFYRVC